MVNVARGSQQELLADYEDFLRQRGWPVWGKDDPRVVELRQLAYKNKSDMSDKSYKPYKTYKSYRLYNSCSRPIRPFRLRRPIRLIKTYQIDKIIKI